MVNATFHLKKDGIRAAYNARQAMLNAQTRKKREASESVATAEVLEEMQELIRTKRALGDAGDFASMLIVPDKVYGIWPKNKELAQAELCECAQPTSRIRKLMNSYVEWSDDLLNLHSDKFKAFKKSFEEKVQDYMEIFTKQKELLNFLVR